ncbi:hypothetical protein ALC56_07102 [Trachymyrmex septentrionalis]|uniref:Double jelly roll-like domain-containing protein n=1 Tax=Trachymyrmex septentrionalis TaxID=34720 RepID=A0A151JWA8_9HYME|nr:hypothetical protein ALC56_07102 [Trachymyrmex septentrionalis]
MVDILNIGGEPIFDDRIVKFEFHTYNPYVNTTFGHSDKLRIAIQQQDLRGSGTSGTTLVYKLSCKSILYVEGGLISKKKNVQKQPNFGCNCAAFMFDEIKLHNAGFIDSSDTAKSLMTDERNFNFCEPFSMLLGFCEDYKRVVINARHELILIRARNGNNYIVGDPAAEPALELFKVQWRIPHVSLNEFNKLSMLSALKSGQYLNDDGGGGDNVAAAATTWRRRDDGGGGGGGGGGCSGSDTHDSTYHQY